LFAAARADFSRVTTSVDGVNRQETLRVSMILCYANRGRSGISQRSGARSRLVFRGCKFPHFRSRIPPADSSRYRHREADDSRSESYLEKERERERERVSGIAVVAFFSLASRVRHRGMRGDLDKDRELPLARPTDRSTSALLFPDRSESLESLDSGSDLTR